MPTTNTFLLSLAVLALLLPVPDGAGARAPAPGQAPPTTTEPDLAAEGPGGREDAEREDEEKRDPGPDADRDPGPAPGRAWLGVELQALDAALREAFDFEGPGVLVAQVAPGSPADRGGIQKGDIIAGVDGRDVRTPAELIRRIRAREPGDTVELARIRKGREAKVEVKLGRTPERLGASGRGPRDWWPRSYLGARVEALGPELARYFDVEPESGVLVVSIEDDSPAARAGLEPGDVIVEFAGKRVRSPDELVRAVHAEDPGSAVAITAIRHGKEQKLETTLAEAPPLHRLRHLVRHGGEDLEPRLRDLRRRMSEGRDALSSRVEKLEELVRDLERRIEELRRREER